MKKIYRIENLDCGNCAAKIERAIVKLEGVTRVNVSFLTQKITLETEQDDQSALMEQVIKISKKVEPDCVVHV